MTIIKEMIYLISFYVARKCHMGDLGVISLKTLSIMGVLVTTPAYRRASKWCPMMPMPGRRHRRKWIGSVSKIHRSTYRRRIDTSVIDTYPPLHGMGRAWAYHSDADVAPTRPFFLSLLTGSRSWRRNDVGIDLMLGRRIYSKRSKNNLLRV